MDRPPERLYYERGNFFLKQKQIAKAQIQYLKSRLKNPNYAEAYRGLGKIYSIQKNYQLARQNYERSIELNQQSTAPNIFYNLALALENLNQSGQALKYYQKAVEKDSKFCKAFYRMGLLYHRLKILEGAQRYYLRANQLQNNNYTTIKAIGILYMDKGQFAIAQQWLLKALKIDSGKYDIHLKLGQLYNYLQQFEKSKQYFLKSIQIFPSPQANFNIGLLFLHQNMLEQAGKYIKISIQMKPNNPLYLMGQAQLLSSDKKYQQAFKIMDKVKELIDLRKIQEIKKQFELDDKIIQWIRVSAQQFQQIDSLNKQKLFMNEQQQKSLTNINRMYFETQKSLIKNPKQELKQLQSIIKKLSNELTVVKNQLNQIKDDVETWKKHLEWDHKFQQLLENNPAQSYYYRCLFSMISTSIWSYRAVRTGIVAAGGNIPTSDAAGFFKNIMKILGITAQFPMIKDFCSFVIKIGEFYLGLEKDYVIKLIVLATEKLYCEKKLTKAVNQMILFLANDKRFQKLLKKDKSDKPKSWGEIFLLKLKRYEKKFEKLKNQALQKISKFKIRNQSNEKQMNLALCHSAIILLNLIKNQNQDHLSQKQNPLLKSCQIWMQNQQQAEEQIQRKKMIIFKILKCELYKSQVENIHSSIYIKILYNGVEYRTQSKSSHNIMQQDPSWFMFKKVNQPIIFVIYRTGSTGEDSMVVKIQVDDDLATLEHVSRINIQMGGKIIGYINVMFYLDRTTA